MNKFENEYDCSNLCIARLGSLGIEEEFQNVTVPPTGKGLTNLKRIFENLLTEYTRELLKKVL